jgi:hypothetical protein
MRPHSPRTRRARSAGRRAPARGDRSIRVPIMGELALQRPADARDVRTGATPSLRLAAPAARAFRRLTGRRHGATLSVTRRGGTRSPRDGVRNICSTHDAGRPNGAAQDHTAPRAGLEPLLWRGPARIASGFTPARLLAGQAAAPARSARCGPEVATVHATPDGHRWLAWPQNGRIRRAMQNGHLREGPISA